MPRLFTGLEIPAEIGHTLSGLRGGLPGARWIDPENYHVTLRFVGDVAEDGHQTQQHRHLNGVAIHPDLATVLVVVDLVGLAKLGLHVGPGRAAHHQAAGRVLQHLPGAGGRSGRGAATQQCGQQRDGAGQAGTGRDGGLPARATGKPCHGLSASPPLRPPPA